MVFCKGQCGSELRLPSKRFPTSDVTAKNCGFPHVDSMELLYRDEEPSPENKMLKSRNTGPAPLRSF